MTVIGFLIIIALYIGQVVLVPLALAVILAFVLAPPVRMLRRTGIGNTASVFVVVSIAFAIIFGVGTVITQQVGDLVEELPRYQATLRDKVKSLKDVASGSGGAIQQASETLKQLQEELESPKVPAPPPQTMTPITPERLDPATGERRPVPVEVRTPAPTAVDQLQTIVGVVLAPLATAGLVLLFVLFLLLQREDVRDRAIRLLGSNDLEKSTTAMDDAGKRLGRYFLTLTLINTAFGIFIAFGLWLIGVPSPVLWGVLAALMRFVPFLGSFIAAACPLILAAAVDPGWSMFLMTLALYVISEPVMGNVIEPVVQGQRTGLSPLAIVLSAAFWTLLWGPIGLLLAIPLTVVLVVLGHHVERLEFLNVLLGDTPPLSPAERFYQRMLAGDPAEAVEQAEAILKTEPLVNYYDDVVIEGLRLAQADADRGTLEPERLVDIRNTADVVIDTLEDYDLQPVKAPKAQKSVIEEASEEDAELAPNGSASDAERRRKDTARRRAEEKDKEEEDDAEAQKLCTVAAGAIDPAWRNEGAILCVASRTALDETAAMVFAQLVSKCGLSVKVVDVDHLRHGALSGDDVKNIRLICISALHVREKSAHARFLVRRLKRSAPNALLLGCFWKLDPEDRQDKAILDSIPVDARAHTLREAVAFTLEAASTPAGEETTDRSRDTVVVRAAS
jgi:predicted PurR-regulated permease PerM